MSSSLSVDDLRSGFSKLPVWKPLFGWPLPFLVAVLLLTVVLGLRFYNEPQLSVGTRVDRTLIAPRTAEVVDWEETQKAQISARTGAVQVFALEPQMDDQVLRRLEDLLTEGNQVLGTAGNLPYVSTGVLSTATQATLRALPQTEWQKIKQLAISNQPQLADLSPGERSLVLALSKRRAANDLDNLLIRIERVRQSYLLAVARNRTAPVVYQERLLNLTTAQWRQVSAEARQVTRRLLAMGIVPGLPQQIRQQGVVAQLSSSLSAVERQIVIDLVLSVIQANLSIDRLETLREAERNAQSIQPIQIHIEAGQVLLRQGDVVTPRWFEILDQLHMTQRGINWLELGLLVLLEATGLQVLLWREGKRGKCCLRTTDRLLTLIIVLWTAGIGVIIGNSWGWGGFLPFITTGLLLGNFYGSRRGVGVLLALALPFWYGLKLPFAIFLPVLAGGLIAAWLVGRLRSREEVALLGILAALTQGAVYAVLTVLFTQGYDWRQLAIQTLQMAGGGLVCSIVALGASPYLERLFDVVTPVRLSELANPNRSLLKRLATEAPGTFQHTMFVANLAEAAAQCLGDNADLVRAGTLYHDIGKMVRARYFIENQMGMNNPHVQLDDPWRSAAIIRDHVSDGLKLARKYGLPKVIQDFIPEHQGTIQIAYFYHQACQQAGPENVRDEDFRYAGPAPQSRETGLVMLADACEAALRSLRDVTESEAVALVQRILCARWREGQLVDSGLREEELPQISRVFVKVWREQNHQRIRYPAPACTTAEFQPTRR